MPTVFELPKTISVVTSFRCNAACPFCCFGSSPRERDRLDPRDVESIIARSVELFSPVVVVFTGGEPTLLWDEMIESVRVATDAGLQTRVVSNGHWATSPSAATHCVEQLTAAGLAELNLSTGSQHARFVAPAHVAHAAAASLAAGMRTVVVVEDDPETQALTQAVTGTLEPNELLSVLTTSRVAFGRHEPTCHNAGAEVPRLSCDSLLSVIAFTPDRLVYPCCGLPLRQMPDLAFCSLEDFLRLGRSEIGSRLLTYQVARILLDGPSRVALEVLGHVPESAHAWQHPCEPCYQLATRAAFFKPEAAEAATDDGEVLARLSLWMFSAGLSGVERGTPTGPSVVADDSRGATSRCNESQAA